MNECKNLRTAIELNRFLVRRAQRLLKKFCKILHKSILTKLKIQSKPKKSNEKKKTNNKAKFKIIWYCVSKVSYRYRKVCKIFAIAINHQNVRPKRRLKEITAI